MAKLKLFKVSRIESIVILALSEKEAEESCNEHDWGEPDGEISITKITKLADLLLGWDGAIPIGNPEDNPACLTCGEILKVGLESQKKPRDLTIKLLAGPEDDGKIAALMGVIQKSAKDLKLDIREE